ncbi:HotDog domain-containing protein [Mucidula mucida]|nr:HotDog domain-containing protein [Mucidula mucida]
MSSTRIHASAVELSTSATPVWVDPASLPDQGDISSTAGNAPDYVKQLNYNTFFSYGVGDAECFGYKAGKDVKFVDVTVDRSLEHHGRMEATTIAEVVVNRGMLNGAGMLHGGCIAYLIDNTPLVVLGLMQGANGVGVTQGLNVQFHSPASLGARIRIISTSVSFGGRVMTSRCEVINKDSGRIIASALLNKMQPAMSKL